MKKKIISLLLAVVMIVGMLPLSAITAFAAAEGVKYLEYNTLSGAFEERTCTDYTLLANLNTDKAKESRFVELTSGWYVVKNQVSIVDHYGQGAEIEINGDVHIILADDCKLTVGCIIIMTGSVTIYAQSEGENAGELEAKGYAWLSGIGGNGTVTINGGNITACGNGGAGIGGGYHEPCGDIVFNGGKIAAYGNGCAGIGDGVMGEATCGNITINGGDITAIGCSVTAGGTYADNGIENRTNGKVIINGGHITSIGGKAPLAEFSGKPFNAEIVFGENVCVFDSIRDEMRVLSNVEPENYCDMLNSWTLKDKDSRLFSSFTVFKNTLADKAVKHYAFHEESGITLADLRIIDFSNVSFITSDTRSLTSGWYVLSESVTLPEGEYITVNGDVHLVLCDECELKIPSPGDWHAGIELFGDNSLTVYGQISGTGSIVAYGGSSSAGIGGGYNANGGTVTINSGIVTAYGYSGGAGIGGGFNGSCGDIEIYGGCVTAVSEDAAGIGRGNDSFGYTLHGELTLADDLIIRAGATADDNASVTAAQYKANRNSYVSIHRHNFRGKYSANDAVTHSRQCIFCDLFSETIKDNHTFIEGVCSLCNYRCRHNYVNNVCTLCGKENITSYIARSWDSDKKQVVSTEENIPETAQKITADTTTLSSGWYTVDDEVTVDGRITVSGNANLILKNGCILEVKGGIKVSNDNSLTIYAQSDRDNMGSLIADSNSGTTVISGSAGIGGDASDLVGNITVHGGRITATGGDGGAGIGGGLYAGGGNVTVYNGKITATGGYRAAGIGAGNSGEYVYYIKDGGTLTVHGGDITATGSDGAAGIGGGYNANGGTVTINGGKVIATGGQDAAGIGGGYFVLEPGLDLYGDGGTVTVNGGNITATGKGNGAGIGGGCNGNGNTFIMTGGVVSATGENGAGIGGGYNGYGSDFIFSGGSVTALSAKGAGIGVGYNGGSNFGGHHEFTVADGTVIKAGDTAADSFVTAQVYAQYRYKNVSVHLHDYTGEYKDNGNGTHSRQCAYCDVFGGSEEHTFVDHKCVCGATNDHNFTGEYKDNGNGTHSRKCTECDEYGAPVAHTWQCVDKNTHKCTFCETVGNHTDSNKDGKCDLCGYELCTHANTEIVYEWNENYTICTATKRCSDCKEVFATETKEAYEADFVLDTVGNCQTKHTGHNVVYFDNEEFGTAASPANSFAFYFGYHTDKNGDGICDDCEADLTVTGSIFKSGIFRFMITDGENKTVTVMDDRQLLITIDDAVCLYPYEIAQSAYTGNLVIPETVTYGNKTFTVTAIGTDDRDKLNIAGMPFIGCTELSGITLPDTIKVIGEGAFFGCTGLTEIVIPESVEKICREAFSDCDNLKTVTFKSKNITKAPHGDVVVIGAFAPVNSVEKVIVPLGTANAYKTEWDCFADIIVEDNKCTYLDESGEMKTAVCDGAIDSNTTEYTTGWYVLTEDAVFDKAIVINGDVKFILCDGATLTANKGILLTSGNTLTVYAQSTGEDMGKIIATGDDLCAGIGGGFKQTAGDFTVNGGYIKATGGYAAPGIGGGFGGKDGTFTQNGGTVIAVGGEDIPHEHTYSTDWSFNETHHWHACTCEDDDCNGNVTGFGEHHFDDGVVNGNVIIYTCHDCGYELAITCYKVDAKAPQYTENGHIEYYCYKDVYYEDAEYKNIIGGEKALSMWKKLLVKDGGGMIVATKDSNKDGKFDELDIILVTKALINDAEYDETFDTNCDGKFNICDLVRLKLFIEDGTPLGNTKAETPTEIPTTEAALPDKKEIA